MATTYEVPVIDSITTSDINQFEDFPNAVYNIENEREREGGGYEK